MSLLQWGSPELGRALGHILGDFPPTWLCVTGHSPAHRLLGLVVQLVFNPFYCPHIEPIICHSIFGDIMGDNDKRYTSQRKPHPLLCPYASSWSRHCGGNQVGQAWYPLCKSLLTTPEYTSCFEPNVWEENKKRMWSPLGDLWKWKHSFGPLESITTSPLLQGVNARTTYV